MVYLFISIAAVIFFETFARIGVLGDVRKLNSAVAQAFAVIRDPATSDLEKEKASRRGALQVSKHLGLTLVKISAAVALSTLALWILCRLADVPFQNAVSLSASLVVIIALIPMMLIYGGLRHVFRH